MAPIASAQYTYGQYLEPPAGTVLQGMGQFWGENTDNQQYLDAIAPYGDAVKPGHDMIIVNIAPTNQTQGHYKPFDQAAKTHLLGELANSAAAQRVPHVAISFHNYIVPDPIPGQGMFKPTAHDIQVADNNAPEHAFMMGEITLLGQALYEFGQPVFVRIGLEFNNANITDGTEGYHAFYFPVCYRKTVAALEAAGAKRCAFIWCWEASAPTDYAYVDPGSGAAAWYPGDNYVDWFGLDIFNRNEFTTLTSPIYPVAPSHLTDVENFLAFAAQKSRPVFVAESSCVDFSIVAGDLNGSWTNWFTHYFSFLSAHPSIKAIDYISHDWTGGSGGPEQWLDGRIANSTQVTASWAGAIGQVPFIGKGSGPILNGYDGWWGVGNALAGSTGLPLLRGYGPVKANQQITVTLTNAKTNTTAALYIGFSAINLPFKGGVMVPAPDLVVNNLNTGATGSITLTSTWPAGVPSGFKTFYQYWIVDSAGPQGFSASNGLMGETL